MKEPVVLEKIREAIDKFENSTIYFTTKQMHVHRVSEQQIFAIKIFLALREAGIVIVTSHLFMSLYGRSRAGSLQMLHELGDKGILTLVKNKKSGPLRYMLSTMFLEYYQHQHQKI